MTGMNARQTAALADAIERDLKAQNLRPLGVEGAARGEWILMDYGWFFVHVFSPAARDYYALEKLWGDAPGLEGLSADPGPLAGPDEIRAGPRAGILLSEASGGASAVRNRRNRNRPRV